MKLYEILFRFQKPTADVPANTIAAIQCDEWTDAGTPANQPRRLRSADAAMIAPYLDAALVDQRNAAIDALRAAREEHAAALQTAREEHAAALQTLREEHATALAEATAGVAAAVAERDARIEELTAALAIATEERRQAIVRRGADLEAMRRDHEAELQRVADDLAQATAAAQGEAAERRARLIALINGLPDEAKGQFAGAIGTVIALRSQGLNDLALDVVRAIPVPEELQPAKAAILAELE